MWPNTIIPDMDIKAEIKKAINIEREALGALIDKVDDRAVEAVEDAMPLYIDDVDGDDRGRGLFDGAHDGIAP